MIIALGLAGNAFAGAAFGVTVGPVVPLDRQTTLDAGMQYSAYFGDRASIGPVHLQPELVGRWNAAADAGALGAGGAVTLSIGPVALGPYAHVGVALSRNFGPAGDIGALGEITLLKPLFLGLRTGWQRDGVGYSSGGFVDSPAGTHWFGASAEVGLVF